MTTHIKLDVHGTPTVARYRPGGWPLICPVVTAVCILFGGASAFAASVEPAGAEYAIRWNAHEGGPKTGVDVLAVLKARTRRASTFKVDYYDLPSTTTTAPGFSAILRRRIDHAGNANLTWKLRGNHALAGWTCPLRISGKTKVEVDVTFSGAGTGARMYSYSCTSENADTAASGLSAKLKACTAHVTRWETGRLKVEEWQLPGNVLMLEVSGSDTNTREAMERFRTRVAVPLLAAGIVPSVNSKAELGSRCQ